MSSINTFPTIRKGFKNSNGIIFNDLREVAHTKNSIATNLGIFITETEYNDEYIEFNPIDSELEGVYIFKDRVKQNVGYRIYKEFSECRFDGYKDDHLVSELIERQKEIKYTDYPTGVVTLDGRIIGQEIVYYDNSVNLEDFCFSGNKIIEKLEPTKIYMTILKSIKEQYEKGIYYLDGHPKNFIIKLDLLEDKNCNYEDIVKMIDFRYDFMFFDTIADDRKKIIFRNLICSINYLNMKFNLIEKTGMMENSLCFNEIEEKIMIMEKKINFHI